MVEFGRMLAKEPQPPELCKAALKEQTALSILGIRRGSGDCGTLQMRTTWVLAHPENCKDSKKSAEDQAELVKLMDSMKLKDERDDFRYEPDSMEKVHPPCQEAHETSVFYNRHIRAAMTGMLKRTKEVIEVRCDPTAGKTEADCYKLQLKGDCRGSGLEKYSQ